MQPYEYSNPVTVNQRVTGSSPVSGAKSSYVYRVAAFLFDYDRSKKLNKCRFRNNKKPYQEWQGTESELLSFKLSLNYSYSFWGLLNK